MESINVGVYAISCRKGGALSVLTDFYNEITIIDNNNLNIHWTIFTSINTIKNTENVTIINCKRYIRSWFHRVYFNFVVAKRIIKKNNIVAMVSLQNMQLFGFKGMSIISLHNVLPLYKCSPNVLESFFQRIKQRLVNHLIISSLKKANYIFVPGRWIKDQINKSFGIDADKIVVSSIKVPVINYTKRLIDNKQGFTTFFYPAKSFPYKNHSTILKACELLKKQGFCNYRILFTFDLNESKTSLKLYKIASKKNLPVEFVGVLPRNEVLSMYKNCILLFPSLIETDAMPIMEAIQMGGLVLSADLPYAREASRGYDNIYFFQPKDDVSLCSLMEKSINGTIIKQNNINRDTLVIDYNRVEKMIKLLELSFGGE